MVVLLLAGAPGCQDESVYSCCADEATARATQAVVLRNVTALERGDGRAYCATYTPRHLEQSLDGYAGCVAAFRGPPDPRARPPRIDFGDVLTSTDDHAIVEFRDVSDAGGASTQSYHLDLTEPARQVGTDRRWLIDLEAVDPGA